MRQTGRCERLCVEVIHRPGKTGGRSKGKSRRATLIIQIFVRSEVKAQCVYYIMIGHRVLIGGPWTTAGSVFWAVVHPSIHWSFFPALQRENHFFVRPLPLHPSFPSFINKLVKPAIFFSISSSIHPFIRPAAEATPWSIYTLYYLSIIHSSIILSSTEHTTQLYRLTRPLIIVISFISVHFSLPIHIYRPSFYLLPSLSQFTCSGFVPETSRNCVLSPTCCIIQGLEDLNLQSQSVLLF